MLTTMQTPTDRLGYHYYPDDRHYTQKDLGTWLPILEGLGARWLTLRASAVRAVPERFVRGLVEAGIAPVIQIPATVGALGEADLMPLLTSYGRWGVRQVVVFDRPNLRRAWDPADWGRASLVERFLDRLIPVLQAERAAGLRPVFPALEPGGDYWDTAFLAAALQGLARRGQHDLLRDLTLGMYVWTNARPLDWGAGGPARWAEARPYHTPPGCQDQLGFRIFEWYAAVTAGVAPAPFPMLVLAGGATLAAQVPGLGSDPHTEANLAIARALSCGDVPASVLNFAFFLLAADAGTPEQSAAWFPEPERPRPIVAAIQRFLAQEPKAAAAPQAKWLKHYLLLSAAAQGPATLEDWAAIAEYARVFRPTVGFSAAEARHAEQVTLVGDERSIPASVEAELRAAGCIVQRVLRPGPSAAPFAFHPSPFAFPTDAAGAQHG